MIYLFFEFAHNVRRRDLALLDSLLDTPLHSSARPKNPISANRLGFSGRTLPTE